MYSNYEHNESPKHINTSRKYVDESSMFDICYHPEITESPVSKPKNKFSQKVHNTIAYESNKQVDKYRLVIDSNGTVVIN